MHLGEGRENWTRIGGYRATSKQGFATTLSQNTSVPGALFSFGDLTRLTTDGVEDAALRTQLLKDVKAASDAASTGQLARKDQAIAAFVATLQKASGMSVPSMTADYLCQIARSI